MIKSVLTYLTDVYGHEYMSKKPSEILDEQKANNGAPVERGKYVVLCGVERLLLETPAVWSSLDLAHLDDDDVGRYSPRSPVMSSSGMSLYLMWHVTYSVAPHLQI